MKKIEINIPQKKYNIYIGKNILKKIPAFIKKETGGRLFLIIDRNVNKYFSRNISETFSAFDYKKFILTAKEENKTYATLQNIHKALIKNNFERDSVIIAIGGGITGDVAGFAAATYMRGIKYIQVPTTLLAAVDSSVGGKTGINFAETKNIIGSFHQPEAVFIDTGFFKTLPQEEILSGTGEIVKYAFITGPAFFDFIKNNLNKLLEGNNNVITKVMAESVRFKGDVVAADEKEKSIRKILNFGHTFAHAYEVEMKHKLKHGQAVITGIASALYLSNRLLLLADKDFERFIGFINFFSDKIKLKKINANNIYKIMRRDKKNRNNKIKFVLLKETGKTVTGVEAPRKIILDSIDFGTKIFRR